MYNSPYKKQNENAKTNKHRDPPRPLPQLSANAASAQRDARSERYESISNGRARTLRLISSSISHRFFSSSRISRFLFSAYAFEMSFAR